MNTGRAFADTRTFGKLYPAVSMDFTEKGCEISAVFPGKDGTSADFAFQGDYASSETLVPVVVEQDGEAGV